MKYIYIDIAISIVFFYNIQAERCEIWWLKRECYSKPCSCCSSEKSYFSIVCSECCKKNGNRFCVVAEHYHRCEPASTISDRPYTEQTPLNKTDQYSSNSSSKRSLGVTPYIMVTIYTISVIVPSIVLVVCSGRWIRKQLRKKRIREQLRHERRNVTYTSANIQSSRNDRRVHFNPIIAIGDEETTIPADIPPVYSVCSYNCAQNVTNGDLQNDPPPVYSICSCNCAQNVTNGDLQNDPPPVYTHGSYNCAQNVTNDGLQNDPPPVYTHGSYNCAQNVTNGDEQNDPPPVYSIDRNRCAQNVTNGDLQNDPPPVNTHGSYNCAQNVTNGDEQNDPPPFYSIGRYSCTINVTNM
ncbi:uncharacterized protein LOC134696598 [Mytilus trossulus]|uniref:uncharacterized protein LOC134696598 n=1 Tax=Mytilus trossulus TaxID=6551 RepID=UPI003003F851